MSKKAIKAIKESIAHWYRISDCKTPYELLHEGFDSDTCPLCQEFDSPSNINDCMDIHNNKCPVAKKTGKNLCYGSPYYAALDSLESWIRTEDWSNTDQTNIEAEVRFLESLLDD